MFFFLIIPPPPKSTLFPYTTLFRSQHDLSFNTWGHFSATGTQCHLSWTDAGVVGVTGFEPVHDRRSEEHTSELQSRLHLVCRLLLEKKKKNSFNSVAIKMLRCLCRG